MASKRQTKSWVRDAAERFGWTVAEVAVAWVTTELVPHVGPEWVVPITAVLTAVKVYVAKHLGSPSTAAIAPGE